MISRLLTIVYSVLPPNLNCFHIILSTNFYLSFIFCPSIPQKFFFLDFEEIKTTWLRIQFQKQNGSLAGAFKASNNLITGRKKKKKEIFKNKHYILN
jgi:hypothetical protein